MPSPKPTEIKSPEKFADFLVSYAKSPGETIASLARQCGLPERTALRIVERLEGVYQPVTEEIRRGTTESLIKQIEQKLPMLLDGITQDKVNNSALREIAVAFGVLAEKRQLLRGEPTQILTYEERDNMNKLAPYLLKELERRGMVVDVDYQEVPNISVAPPDVVQDSAVSKTAAEHERRKNRAKNR